MVNKHTAADAIPAVHPDAQSVPSMRGTDERPALVQDERPVEPGPITRDSEAFLKLAEDKQVLRVLWMLAVGFTWPWLLEDATTPAARNRAIRRGLVAPPVGARGAELVPYHLTDAGRAELLAWVHAITPHRGVRDVDVLWVEVTAR
ncbi:hypothetical protein C8D88_11191 [Lentzea atacamensis]|uniref:Uncharacterized protein n=1 Tax=Lentzea atacamensis TaxID=531938 RepID=A0A316HRX2_9PSEU|nr:hypothetical protein [Lentzea atacamensis]PWK83206.1 hypothetical protein C8D88_11191 [Lentzea atacamensis]